MDEILRSLGMIEDVIRAFKDNNVGPKEVFGLNDSEFEHLGVLNIGDRVRIRQTCKAHIDNEAAQSPVVSKLRNLLKNRRLATCPSKKQPKEKETLRISVGWKHCEKGSELKQVPARNGGGTLSLDLPKNSTKDDIMSKFVSVFFPDGKNISQGLRLSNVTMHIATFSGKRLEEFCVGREFTLRGVCDELGTHPVRLYLETALRSEQSSDDDELSEDELPDIFKLNDTPQPQTSGNETVQPDTPTVSFPRHTQGASHQETTLGCYESYVNLLEDEEEDIAVAIDKSLQDVIGTPLENSSSDELPDIKRNLSELVQGATFDIIIRRNKINESTKRAVMSEGFSFWSPVKVTFSGEDAVDDGGPRREFFKLLMNEVRTRMGVFESAGDLGMVSFTHNLALLRQQAYKLAGQYTTWSFVNGGPGLQALSPCTFAVMLGKDVQPGDMAHLSDCTARENLMKLQNCRGQHEFEEVLTEQLEWLIEQGVTKLHGLQIDRDRDRLCSDLLLQQVYYRVQPAIMQFVEGLGPLWEKVKRNPGTASELFIHSYKPLTMADVKKLYIVEYSPQGSNNRIKEEDTVYSFEIFLQNCQERKSNISLEELLDFWTAADRIPPCGFEKTLVVDFYTRVTGIRRLPSSHTCGPILWLPRGVEVPEELEQLLSDAIKNCQGFGKI